jgi:hypothetical protein
VPSLDMVSTDYASTDPLLCTVALERHFKITISPDVHIIYVRITGFLDLKLFTSLSILVSGLSMLYHNFHCILSCYHPLTVPGLRFLYSCGYTDMGCPVIEVSSF